MLCQHYTATIKDFHENTLLNPDLYSYLNLIAQILEC